MRILRRLFAMTVMLVVLISISVAAAQEKEADQTPAEQSTVSEPLPEEYSCTFCHGESGTLAGSDETRRLIVTEKDLAEDIHWQQGLRCHDCHGGSATLDKFANHRDDPSFHSLTSPSDIPGFCGRCHSDVETMRRYQPSPRVDQEAEYWTSGHGQQLKEKQDTNVATCVSCHSHHDIRAVDDLESPVFPTRVASTCAACHSDAQRMADREYHGRPLGHDQAELWNESVHAQAMKKGDLSAPTCNDCHGNHGALPSEISSVANVCGTCHVKVAQLFSKTLMKYKFDEFNLPGCATCHGNHEIHSPTDDMLGMENGAVCAGCHLEGKHGATLAGAKAAQEMRSKLESLKEQITLTEHKLDRAEYLGMEIRVPRFRLREATDALTNARTLVHSFAIDPMSKTLEQGMQVSIEVEQKAEEALQEYTNRRIWLALSVAPILLVVGLLVLYIRTLPPPEVH